jgi:hypothetical protein
LSVKISGKAQGEQRDAAEAWLRANDLNYAQSKRGWIAPTTDALIRTFSEVNKPHPSMDDIDEMFPKGSGAYRRRVHLYNENFEDTRWVETSAEDATTSEDDE